MPYDESVEQLIRAISELDYVKKFKKTDAKLHENTQLFERQETMKAQQKEAILYQKIGKINAYKVTSQAAQKIEKSLKSDILVAQYFTALQDVNDLIQHVTSEIEQKVNVLLENDESKPQEIGQITDDEILEYENFLISSFQKTFQKLIKELESEGKANNEYDNLRFLLRNLNVRTKKD